MGPQTKLKSLFLAAALAMLWFAIASPNSVFADPLYVSDFETNQVFSVAEDGTITPFAGGLSGPQGMARVGDNIYVTNSKGNSVSKITPSGTVSTFATDDFRFPKGIVSDSVGNLYVADTTNNRIAKITPGGFVTTFAIGVEDPTWLAFNASGDLFVSEYLIGRISRITPAGVVSTFATDIAHPQGLAFDPNGNLYALNSIQSTSTLYKYLPDATRITVTTLGHFGEGVSRDSAGYVYVGANNQNSLVRVSPTGVVQTWGTFPGGNPVYALVIPEPTSLGLLAAGAVIMLRRRRGGIRN